MKKRYIFFYVVIFVVLLSKLTSVKAVEEPEINSGSAILIEQSTSKTLYSKDSDMQLEPASVTKILTAILAIENCSLNDVVTVPAEAVSNIPSGYSIANLLPNEQITVDQLLKVLMVFSANDAANVLAYHIDGSISNFANRMNDKLASIGLKDSHFTNPSGMHDENHYSTAHDIALLTQYCMKNSTFKNYSSLKSCHIPATNLSPERDFNNTNPMINPESESYYEPLISTKTGFTSQSMYCLSSFAKKDNLSLICVILHAESSAIRFSETRDLFEYGFNNFGFNTIAKTGDVITQITVENATSATKSLDIVLDDSINILSTKPFLNVNTNPQIILSNIPSAPIIKDQVLGTAIYTLDDKKYSINLVASHDVEIDTSTNVVPKTSPPFYLLQLALLIIVVIFLFVFLFWKKEKKN